MDMGVQAGATSSHIAARRDSAIVCLLALNMHGGRGGHCPLQLDIWRNNLELRAGVCFDIWSYDSDFLRRVDRDP